MYAYKLLNPDFSFGHSYFWNYLKRGYVLTILVGYVKVREPVLMEFWILTFCLGMVNESQM